MELKIWFGYLIILIGAVAPFFILYRCMEGKFKGAIEAFAKVIIIMIGMIIVLGVWLALVTYGFYLLDV